MPPLPVVPPAVLEVFYSPTCAPCRLELPDIARLVAEGAPVRITILDAEARARTELTEVSPSLNALATAVTGNPRDRLRAAGNPNGLLPYAGSVSTDSGANCATWAGRLTVSTARRLLTACTRPASEKPPPSRF
jgi:hypothetical protein